MSATLTIERLRALLCYDLETGLFKNLVNRNRCAMAGGIAGNTDKNGYVMIKIDRKAYLAHRLAWFYVHGHWPAQQIDRRSQRRRNGVRWTAKLCPDGREMKTMKLTQAISRANSHFRYWIYRKTIGKPFPLRFAVTQWFRRLAFELAGIGSGA